MSDFNHYDLMAPQMYLIQKYHILDLCKHFYTSIFMLKMFF